MEKKYVFEKERGFICEPYNTLWFHCYHPDPSSLILWLSDSRPDPPTCLVVIGFPRVIPNPWPRVLLEDTSWTGLQLRTHLDPVRGKLHFVGEKNQVDPKKESDNDF